MTIYQIKIRLLSDTTFGRGDGVAGLVDQEVTYDNDGFPYLRGRTLKGLLSEACDALVGVLPKPVPWIVTLQRLYGKAGSTVADTSRWHFGDAQLPGALRAAIGAQLQEERAGASPKLTPLDILTSLTTIRRRTAIGATTGAPEGTSLRTMRVIMRDLIFTSAIESTDDQPADRQLLAAGCLALRQLGAGRNRGRGHVVCTLHDVAGSELTATEFALFAKEVA